MPAPVSHRLAAVIKDILAPIGDAKLRGMAETCLRSTLDTTVQWAEGEDPFVITGDISAMWLRDSSCQVEPYVRFVGADPILAELVAGIIRRQAFYIQEDAYANAFNRTASHAMGFPRDLTEKNPWVFERKFELDSLCHPVRLWWMYWRATGDRALFSPSLARAIARILDVMETEQEHANLSAYSFRRPHAPESDTLTRGGKGSPVARTGMVWSGFRPSDDACRYHYLIPAQMFAVVALDMMAELVVEGLDDSVARDRIARLQGGIAEGVAEYATVVHPEYGAIWAYEVDGLGHHVLMDDANVPSLLSLPYLGYCATDDPQYLRTRDFVLSEGNPYFYAGKAAAGIGSPHTPAGRFWPIAVAIQGLTSTSESEMRSCIDMLVKTDAGMGVMHESVDVNDPGQFTRPWFAWANSLFAELVLRSLGMPSLALAPRRALSCPPGTGL